MKMYRDAKINAEKGKDIDIEGIYICSICGFTHIGKPPEYCPICGVSNNKFREF